MFVFINKVVVKHKRVVFLVIVLLVLKSGVGFCLEIFHKDSKRLYSFKTLYSFNSEKWRQGRDVLTCSLICTAVQLSTTYTTVLFASEMASPYTAHADLSVLGSDPPASA